MVWFGKKNQEIQFLQQQLSQSNNHIASLENEIDHLKSILSPEVQDTYTIKKSLDAQVASLRDSIDNISDEIEHKQEQLQKIEEEIKKKSDQSLQLDDEILYQDFGLYEPKYNCTNSDEYKELLQKIRKQQKTLISEKQALNYYDNWSLDGSRSKGRAMNNDNMKMALLAFNGECDSLINKVKFNNIERIEDRILKAADRINRLNKRNQISITSHYQSLKLEELRLCYEYELKNTRKKKRFAGYVRLNVKKRNYKKKLLKPEKASQKNKHIIRMLYPNYSSNWKLLPKLRNLHL